MDTRADLMLTSKVVCSSEQVSETVDAQAVLLSISKGKYYSMNKVATRIWDRIQQPVQVSNVVDDLIGEFSVERPECETAVIGFLTQLCNENLAEIRN